MSLVGLTCRSCLRVVGLSAQHWLKECREPTMDPGLLQEALDRQRARQMRVAQALSSFEEPAFEVSEILGGVRDVFLRRHMPYYAEGQSFNSTEVGTAVGHWSEQGLSKLGWVTQELVQGRVKLGNVEIDLLGWIDARTADWSILRDTKFGSQGSFFYAQGRGLLAAVEDAAQVSLYDELARQSVAHGIERDTQLEVWYGTTLAALDYKTGKQQDSWMRTRAIRMPLAEIAAVRSRGCKMTVGETAEVLLKAEQRMRAGENAVEVARDIPPDCETMFGGKKCTAYCGPVYTCFGLRGEDVRKAGKPQIRSAQTIFG